jgi:hypothetical protein
MFAWIQSLHDKLHALGLEFLDETSALKARVEALERKVESLSQPEKDHKPVETPPAT